MEANSESFSFLNNAGSVEVPFFQRGYVWDKDNWEDLLDNLFEFEKQPFLGSVILKQQPTKSGAPKKTVVIDGQQRLTSLSILLKALYDSFPEKLKDRLISYVRGSLFFKNEATEKNFMIKIIHSRLDSEAYEQVIRAGIDNGDQLDVRAEPVHRITACYKYFRSELNSRSEEDRKRLFNRIVDYGNKMLVVIDLRTEDDEQAIFDTINSAGVRLTCSDIVKNSLFQGAIQLGNDRVEAVELYKKTWGNVFLSDDEASQFWEKQAITGRLSRDNVEILLHSVAIIKDFFDPDRHTLSELSKLYKKQVDECTDMSQLVPLIREIAEYADIYRKNMPTFGNETLFSVNNKNQRLFHVLDVLQISTFHPFILYVFKQDEQVCDRYLSYLEKYVVRRMICNKETKNYNKLCKKFLKSPEALVEAAKETTDEEVKNGLKSIGNKNAALLLFWVELKRRYDSKKYDELGLKYAYSLEHVMPVKWEDHWATVPEKKKADGSDMSYEEAKKDRYEKIYWIGNMTLLTSSLNSALRNFSFEKKMNGDGRKRGIRDYSSLSITRGDIVEPYEKDRVPWNEDKIAVRNSKLTDEILQIWNVD